VLHVVHGVRHVVGPVHHLRLQAPAAGLGALAQPGEHLRVVGVHPELALARAAEPRVLAGGVQAGPGEVEPGTGHLRLQPGEHPQRLGVALEAAARAGDRVQRLLPVVAERRVAEVVGEAGRVHHIRVAAEPLPHLPGALGHLQGVGQPGTQEVVGPALPGGGVHLGLGGQPPESGRVQHPGPVARVRAAAGGAVLGRLRHVALGVSGPGHRHAPWPPVPVLEAGPRPAGCTTGTSECTVAVAATTGVVPAAGRVTVTSRPPPSSRALARTVPPCASQTARTIASPSPAPRAPVRSRPPRRNGSNRPGTSAGSTSNPVLLTTRVAWRSSAPVVTWISPCRWLYRTAFSTRLPARRSSRPGSPTTGAGARSVSTRRLSRRISFSIAVSAAAAPSARSDSTLRTSRRPDCASLRASTSSASTRALARSEASRTTRPMRRSSSRSASGSSRVTSTSVRITANGVRSSWEALATNRRWVSNASASRSSIASKVAANSATSSSAPE